MGGLFPKAPKVEPASRMPDAQDPAILEERRRKLAEQRQRGGRDSTIMSDNLTGSTGKLGA
ncbi:hypothetical protein LRP31_25520 [Mesorhizobium mediterraneum]|uniref:Uncharacterized protein n=1 Tax=Mesorhizobium mediterraneum TaxID=43617 RepID=A0AB36R8U0_9HYPH|nr:hypothetical protein [Mesorhizobium mediterraneum]PAQ00920.1 hypothetical protein CIT25_17795 [Mesorhizobium mediterraneum]WIW52382.1 hypothetical protein LRP31_25520 [Mesorhizobium mediterraneum]